jgi:2-(1,2-epoxy-1,2-dihydrophenyl)acetyl-CoA isomerase
MTDLVLVERKAGFRKLTLNRPDKLNAFDPGLHEALMAALREAEADPACRALLLTGAGRAFSAGADLQSTQSEDLGAVLERAFNPLIRFIRTMRLPIVCAVNGIAAGAGANVALACDIVLAGRSAQFIQSFIRIGLVPDAGGTWLLPRLAGAARARAMAMLGDPVTAEQALAWGLIWQVADDATLLADAQALTARLATQPTATLGLIKRALDAAATNTLDAQLDLERDLQRSAGRGPDFAEGVKAFLEKRPPVFNGRL